MVLSIDHQPKVGLNIRFMHLRIFRAIARIFHIFSKETSETISLLRFESKYQFSTKKIQLNIFLSLFFFFKAIFYQTVVQSQTSTSNLPLPPTQTSKVKVGEFDPIVNEAKPFKYSLKALAESQYYPSPATENQSLTSSQYTEVDAEILYEKSFFEFKSAAAFATYFRPGESYYAVYDLYSSFRPNENIRFNLGRKLMNWSYLDSAKNVGLWQPKFALDPLRQKQQGLTGLSTEFNSRFFSFKALYSPLHVPSIGSDLKVKNGDFVTSNRWSRPPSNRLNFIRPENQNKIDYNLEIGNISSLVNNSGESYQVRTQIPFGLFLQGSWADKPINDILVLREDYKPANGADTAIINLRPAVGYHEIRTLEAGYESEGFQSESGVTDKSKANAAVDFRFVLSATEDLPAKVFPDRDKWVIQQPQKAEVYGVLANLRLNNFKLNPSFLLSYTKIKGGKFLDFKNDGQLDNYLTFENRFLFYDYFTGSVEVEFLRLKGQPLSLKSTYIYDQLQKGSLVSMVTSYMYKKKWGVHLGTDLLGVENENSDKTFLNTFRANDRFYGGLDYVF